MTTLSIDRIVRVSINLQPLAAARRNFGVLLIAGSSPVIDQVERIRSYTSIEQVGADFGVDDPEYQAALLFFAQVPRPYNLHIGRWFADGAQALLRGAILPADMAQASAWTGIDAGSFRVAVDGDEAEDIVDLNFTGVTTMSGVAAIIDAALATAGAGCTWDGSRFVIASDTVGAGSSLSYLSTAATGTAIAAMMRATEATASALMGGIDPETPAEATMLMADRSGDWYGLMFADPAVTDEQHLAVAAYIEAASKSRIYGITITDTRALDATYELDVASQLKALSRRRTCVTYSANPYAIASAFGRAFTVNFAGNKTTITLKFKQLPGIVAEGLTESQAQALADKRCNVFVQYDNDTAIFQEGTMSGQAFFDEIHSLDWLQNALQNSCYNLLYQSKTKIPQTDGGVNQIVTTLESVFGEAIDNGLIAPGAWNADGFGQLERGDYLAKGYYIYAQPMADQDQSEREQRKAPPIRCAIKLAGAIHFVDVEIDVNR